MSRPVPWRFLVHLWTLAGLAFAMVAAQRILMGDFDAAMRWLLLILFVDHTDGTLARRLHLSRHFPRISGETLDLVTDVIGLTFVPMLFCWRAEVFLPGWETAVVVGAAVTCSYKYAMKANVLKEGYSRGAPPVFFSVLLFWLLELPQVWATAYAVALIMLCWSPVRYPITSLVTTHWKPGFASVINYLSFAAMIPAMVLLRDAPPVFYWAVLLMMFVHLFIAPFLLVAGVLRPGFRRVY